MQTVGLHLEGTVLQLTLIRKSKNAIHCEFLQTFAINNETEVKRFYKALSILKTKKAKFVSALSSEDIVCRELNLKIKSKRALLSALPYQVDSFLPYPEDETLLFPIFYRCKEGQTPITLFATSTKLLEAHLLKLKKKQLDPDIVSTLPNALRRFTHHFFPKLDSALIFHVGMFSTLLCVMQNGRICFSQSLFFGKKAFDGAQEKDHFLTFSQEVGQDLKRLRGFLQNKGVPLTSTPPLFTGELALAPLLEKEFGPSIAIDRKDFSKLQTFAPSFGLALDGSIDDQETVQLRQGSLTSTNSKKTRSKLHFLYLTISLGLALVFGTVQHVTFKAKERSFEKKISALLNKDLSLKEGIATLEKEARTTSSFYPYFPTVPNVSDVLHWVSTHPKLAMQDQKDTLDIQHINYRLEQRPVLGGKREKYVAAVEIDFTTTTPSLAREFHQTLLKGDTLVNEKKEIVWKAHQNSYYTKFYLKGKRG